MDLGIAGGLQDAVAGRSGDLEQDVDVLVGREELLGERLAAGRVGEGLRVRGR